MLAALLGLVCGSFATAASHRLPRGLPIAVDRSRCPDCGHELGALDLVPVFSWLLSRGRCRHCAAAVSWRYPAIELATALLFVLAWRQSGGEGALAAALALTALGMVVITVADLEARIIPDLVLLALLPVALAHRWMTGGGWVEGVAGAALGFGITWGVREVFHRLRGHDGLGFGDVKFSGLAGLYLGAQGFAPFLILSGILGLVFGIAWRLSGRGAAFPLGPALAAALLVGLFYPPALALFPGY